MTQLKSLDLRYNSITDISFLAEMTNLQSLYLSSNSILDISFLAQLTNLQSLDLRSNSISDLSFLAQLTNLQSLDLRSNSISDIRPLLFLLKKGIPVKWEQDYEGYGIYVEDNPWEEPPIEIVKQGNTAIINYFEALETQGVDYLYEAKMLIVGDGGVGKTSLAVRIQDRKGKMPAEEATTKGIDVQKMNFVCDADKDFTINIWDFGGQEIYHATHQFFLTKRSLYILVDDTRKSDKTIQDDAFRYWLQTIELFGGDSPLLIVQNEKGDRSKDIDLKQMQGQFGFVKDKYATNLLTNRGLDDLERAVKYHVQNLPHIGQALPKQWVKIREILLDKAEETPFVSLSYFYELCAERRITNKEKALELSQYLHDLGTFLHFQDDALLKKTLILQNDWATAAVYRVLDAETLKAKKGHFAKKDAAALWTEAHYEDMHDDLLALMLKFELCYEIENKKGEYLIPQLLPESQPDNLSWDKAENLQLRYQYGFMPKGLLSRLIVRTHTHLKDTSKAWKNGVVLERNKTFALITETYAANEIAIRINGEHQKELMTIVSEAIDTLNDTYAGIKVDKRIPCNCETCGKLNEPHFYNHEDVMTRITYRKDVISCNKPPFKEVGVMQLMDNLFGALSLEKAQQLREEAFDRAREFRNIKDDDEKIGKPSPPSPPEVTSPQKWYEKWIVISAFVGFFTFLLFWWLSNSLKMGVIAGLLAGIMMIFRNPERWLKRLAQGAFFAFLSTLAMNISIAFQQKTENSSFEFKFSDPPVLLSLALLVFAFGCILVETWQERK